MVLDKEIPCLLAMKRLSHCISDAVSNGRGKALKFGRGGPEISHLMFADDILLVAEASTQQITHIKAIIDNFCTCSGQTINLGKSKIFFSKNTNPALASDISDIMGIERLRTWLIIWAFW